MAKREDLSSRLSRSQTYSIRLHINNFIKKENEVKNNGSKNQIKKNGSEESSYL